MGKPQFSDVGRLDPYFYRKMHFNNGRMMIKSITTDSLRVKDDLTVNGKLISRNTAKIINTPVTSQTIAANGAIAIASTTVLVTAAGAVTGVTLAAGTDNGQMVIIINTGSNLISFDNTASTAKLSGASGTNDSLVAGSALMCVWNGSLWYPVRGPEDN